MKYFPIQDWSEAIIISTLKPCQAKTNSTVLERNTNYKFNCIREK